MNVLCLDKSKKTFVGQRDYKFPDRVSEHGEAVPQEDDGESATCSLANRAGKGERHDTSSLVPSIVEALDTRSFALEKEFHSVDLEGTRGSFSTHQLESLM